jgi:hypothetical protein
MREAVLCWYPFKSNAKMLDLSNGILSQLLQNNGNVSSTGKEFDYAVVLDPDDISVDTLKGLRAKLNSHGRLLIAYENPFALRYWAGKSFADTGNSYDSLFKCGENPLPSKAELTIRLKLAGFEGQKWYYPLTDHWLAHEIYSENYLPDEYLNQRFIPYIADDINLQFDERPLYREVIRGGAFEFMCGAYLVEARTNENNEPCPVDYAAVTAYREPAKRFATIVRSDGIVVKKALHKDGYESLKKMQKNHEELAGLGVNVISLSLEGDSLKMPRLELPTIWDYWVKKLTLGTFDENEMFAQYGRICEAIYKSSANGKCYWELVPANCFYDEKADDLIFFDQEHCWENVSPDVAAVRAIWGLIYSPAFNKESKQNEWIKALKEQCSLTERWDELSIIAHNHTLKEVFNDIFDIFGDVSKAAVKRVKERTTLRNKYSRIFQASKRIIKIGFNKPAIYGYGLRGKTLRRVLEDIGLEVSVIIDKNVRTYKTIEEAPEEYDVLIVSILNDGEDIANELREKVSVPVFTLEELIGGENDQAAKN